MSLKRLATATAIAATTAFAASRHRPRAGADRRRAADRDHHCRGRPGRSHDRHGLRRDQPRQPAHANRAGRSDGRAAVLRGRRRPALRNSGRDHVVRTRASDREPRDLPAGEYWMQPFVNVYTRFPRADGKTVWLHMDQWEGQNWKRSPGNLYGDPVRVTFDPQSATPIRLIADKVIPPIHAAGRHRAWSSASRSRARS